MTEVNAVELIRRSVDEFNAWRQVDPDATPDLRNAELRSVDFIGAYLEGADLRGANLREAELRGVELRYARLERASLRGADLDGADLRGADLYDADLQGADLRGADLREADLKEANFFGADLRETNLRGASINWSSHDLVSAILLQAAGTDLEKRKIAGLVLVSREWCWDIWEGFEDPLREWALDTMAAMVTEGDNAPDALQRHLRLQEAASWSNPITEE